MRRSSDPDAILEKVARGQAACGAFDIRIDRRGVWHHEGRIIARAELVRLFASILHRDREGDFWLVTPAEQGRVTVEDAPFVGVELMVEGSATFQSLRLRTNLDEWVTISSDHPLIMRAIGGQCPARDLKEAPSQPHSALPVPYVTVRRGLEARLLQPVYYALAALVVTDPNAPARLGVWSEGVFFAMGSAEPDG